MFNVLYLVRGVNIVAMFVVELCYGLLRNHVSARCAIIYCCAARVLRICCDFGISCVAKIVVACVDQSLRFLLAQTFLVKLTCICFAHLL